MNNYFTDVDLGTCITVAWSAQFVTVNPVIDACKANLLIVHSSKNVTTHKAFY